jgi:hypothetical protein
MSLADALPTTAILLIDCIPDCLGKAVEAKTIEDRKLSYSGKLQVCIACGGAQRGGGSGIKNTRNQLSARGPGLPIYFRARKIRRTPHAQERTAPFRIMRFRAVRILGSFRHAPQGLSWADRSSQRAKQAALKDDKLRKVVLRSVIVVARKGLGIAPDGVAEGAPNVLPFPGT